MDDEEYAELRADLGDLEARLTAEIGAVSEVVGQLSQKVAAQEKRPKAKTWCWPDLTREQAEQAWTELEGWYRNIFWPTFPHLASKIRPCWYRHPSAITHISQLYVLWKHAYRESPQTPELAGYWLDRWLPHLLKAVDDELGLYCGKEHNPKPVDETKIAAMFDNEIAKDGWRAIVREDLASRPQSSGE